MAGSVRGENFDVTYKLGAASTERSSSSSLTNLTTKSDALGKPIPRTWGRVVVGGALVWASPFYIITEQLKSTAQYYAEIISYGDYNSADYALVTEAHPNATKVTLSTSSDYGIDLCYSVGYEGEALGRRKVFRVKINGTLVYDGLDGYVMPGIGFDIREHTDLDIPAAMKNYALTGKYFYPGQTLITFSQFRTKMWGGAIPQAVEVEFLTEGSLGQVENVDTSPGYVGYDDIIRGISFTDFTRRLNYYPVRDIGGNRIGLRVFNLDTGAFVRNIPFTGYDLIANNNGNNAPLNAFAGQMSFSEELNVVVLTNDQSSGAPALYLDLANEKAVLGVIPGAAGSNVWVLLSKTSGKAVFWGSTIFEGPFTATLSRGSSGEIVSDVERTPKIVEAGLAFYGDVSGWGDGVAVVVLGFVWLVKAAGKITKCAPLPAAYAGYGPYSTIAFNGGAVSQYEGPSGQRIVVAHNEDGTFRDARPFGAGVRAIRIAGGNSPVAGPPNERFYATGYLDGIYYTDLLTLNTMSYPVPAGTTENLYDNGFDAATNKIVVHNAGLHGLTGPSLKSAKVGLIDFIRSLYVSAGIYTAGQVTGAVDIYDEITGAMIIADADVNALVDQLCNLYRLAKTVTNNGVYFYKTRSLNVPVIINEVIDVNDIAVSEDEQDNAMAVNSSRVSDENTPAAISLKFIDEGSEYQENSVTWRRPDAINPNGAADSIALPVVMTPGEALYLVQQAAIDAGNSTFTHEFRLPWRYACYLQPDDIITIVDGPYRTSMQIDEMDINGDLSASCRATSVGSVNVSEIKAPAIIPPSVSIPTGVVEARGYVFDAPLLTPVDNPGADKVLMYYGIGPAREGTYNGGYFGRKPQGGEFASLPTILNRANIAAYACTTALTDKRWTLDTDELAVTRLSGIAPPTRTLAELQAGPLVNIAWYGAPGRWEIVRVSKVSGGKASGILRGLRGTEVFAGLHEPGDLLVFVADAVIGEAREAALVGTVEEWRPVAVGKGFGTASSLPPVTVEGNSARPFAPAAVLGQREPSGDVSLSWVRRDRLGSGWGAAALPLSDPQDYRVRVLTAGGDVVREWRVAAETATYSAADQATDGVAGAVSLTVSVAQMGANGPGFSEMVTIDGL